MPMAAAIGMIIIAFSASSFDKTGLLQARVGYRSAAAMLALPRARRQ